jgi:hypothetical protein
MHLAGSEAIFDAAQILFECLARDRRGGPSSTGVAELRLIDASKSYAPIASDRKNTAMYRRDDDVTRAALSDFEMFLRNSKFGRPNPTTQGDIADLMLFALRRLEEQVRGWKNNCQVTRNVGEYIRFIENKVLLERVSQVAHIQFGAVVP